MDMNLYNKIMKAQSDTNCFVTIIENEKIGKSESNIYYAAKDNVNTKGVKTTASSKILENYIPVYDATIITKLNSSGAVLVGKTSMDELGMGGTNLSAATGPVLNPWDTTRISGGSSGGSAALVATGAVDLAIGTDTGDSIRKPAAFCGVVGIKPTYGRISRYGIIPYASSLDHVGFFTNNINNAAKFLSILSGRDELDMTSSFETVANFENNLNSNLKGKKIAVLKNVYDLIKDNTIKSSFDNIIKEFESKGVKVEMISLNEDLLKVVYPTYMIIANCEASANHSNLDSIRFGVQKDGDDTTEIMINSRTEGLSYNIRKRFIFGSYGLHESNQSYIFKKAQKIRRLIVNEYNDKFKEFDAVLSLANLDEAPKIDNVSIYDEMSNEYLIGENHLVLSNFNGYPSITLPLCFKNNMPIGINVTSKHFEEQTMLNIALAIEEITNLKNLVAKESK